jgi:glycosyltransferase involved in cell wall biosynthesis
MVLQQHPALGSKLRLLHNWVDIDHHNHDEPSTQTVKVDFRQKWNIKQKHIAVFAGVMGPSQYLELILGIAERLQEQKDLLFLLVGDGKEKAKLRALAKEKNLSNVQFEGFISRDVYPELLKVCSIGLVCLSPQNKTPVVPGKILGHMASGLPVVAFLHTASDGHAMIAEAQCGVSENSGDWDQCAKTLSAFMQRSDQFESIGRAGKRYATEHFSKEVCVSELEAMIRSKKIDE